MIRWRTNRHKRARVAIRGHEGALRVGDGPPRLDEVASANDLTPRRQQMDVGSKKAPERDKQSLLRRLVRLAAGEEGDGPVRPGA